MTRPRIQFGIRSLMLIPLVCASACGGWTLNSQFKLRTYRQQLAQVEQGRNHVQQLYQQRTAHRQFKTRALQMWIENAERARRLKSFETQLLDPTGARLSPYEL